MAVINTGLLTKGLRSEFFDRFENTTKHFQELATRIPSTSDSETYRWLGTVPKMREWGSGRLAKGLRTESYSVENLKYEATGLLGCFRPRFVGFSAALMRTASLSR